MDEEARRPVSGRLAEHEPEPFAGSSAKPEQLVPDRAAFSAMVIRLMESQRKLVRDEVDADFPLRAPLVDLKDCRSREGLVCAHSAPGTDYGDGLAFYREGKALGMMLVLTDDGFVVLLFDEHMPGTSGGRQYSIPDDGICPWALLRAES